MVFAPLLTLFVDMRVCAVFHLCEKKGFVLVCVCVCTCVALRD